MKTRACFFSEIQVLITIRMTFVIYVIYVLRTCFFILRGFAEIVVRHDALKAAISDITFVKDEFLENMFEEIVSFYGIAEKDDQENYEARLAVRTLIFLDFFRGIEHDVHSYVCDLD